MQIGVKKLRDTLDLLIPVAPRKPTLKSVGYVWLGDGRAMVTDLLVNVAFELPEAEEPLLLPGKDALEFLKYEPGTRTVEVTADNGKVTLSTGFTEVSFTDLPSVDEFPPQPKLEGESQGVLHGDVLVSTLAALTPYASVDNLARPVLSGVYLAPGDEIEAAAADGFRLAWRVIPCRLSGPSMIIPLKGVDILEHLWKRAAAPDFSGVKDVASLAIAPRLIRLNWGAKYLKLKFDSVTLIICLITGSYPNYHQLIPKETQPPVTVDAETMYRALAQVASVAKDNRGIVRLSWEGEVFWISAKGGGSEIAIPVPAQFTEPGNTAMNIVYLREYFKGRSGVVNLQTESPTTPVLFTYRGKPDTVVMPMFVEKEAKAKVEEKVEELVDGADTTVDAEVDPAAAAAEAEIDAEVDAAMEDAIEASADELEAKIDAEAAEAEVEVEEPVKKSKAKGKK